MAADAVRDITLHGSTMHCYRVMLCIVRTMPSQDVRLSVRLSVTRRYSVETAQHNHQTFFPPPKHSVATPF